MKNFEKMKRILVADDGSVDGQHAVRWAAGLAGPGSGREVHLLEAVALPSIPAEAWLVSAGQLVETAESVVRMRLEAVKSQLEKDGVATHLHLLRWLPAEAALETADRIGADLIVVGRHGRSARRALLGSVSGEISREAKVPVVVVRGDGGVTPPRRILAALDGSPASRVAVAAAAAWFPDAEILGASVRHGDEGLSEAEIRTQLAAAGVDEGRSRALTLDGHPAEQLIEAAKRERIDLLTSGRRGHGPLRDLFVGSVAEKLLQLAPCPILLAH